MAVSVLGGLAAPNMYLFDANVRGETTLGFLFGFSLRHLEVIPSGPLVIKHLPGHLQWAKSMDHWVCRAQTARA